jgi:hypothetical protein
MASPPLSSLIYVVHTQFKITYDIHIYKYEAEYLRAGERPSMLRRLVRYRDGDALSIIKHNMSSCPSLANMVLKFISTII